jgi:hypothetical protein
MAQKDEGMSDMLLVDDVLNMRGLVQVSMF